MYNRMVVHRADDDLTDRVFHALADATRRDIMARTLIGGHSVTELAANYTMSFAAVQKHVSVLHDAGLVAKQRCGREQLVTARIETVADAAAILDAWHEVWLGRIARMDDLLAEHPNEQATEPRRRGN
jgi:DNA-binding transcriptional ArsR family regulator